MQKNITIFQGAQFHLILNLKQQDSAGTISPFDATGFQLRGKLKRCYSAVTAWDFTFSTIDLTIGAVAVKLPATITATLPDGELVYDIEVYDPNDTAVVYKALYGNANVIREVTT